MGEKFTIDPQYDIGNLDTWDRQPSIGAAPKTPVGDSRKAQGGDLAHGLLVGGAGTLGGLLGAGAGFAGFAGNPIATGAMASGTAGAASGAMEAYMHGSQADVRNATLGGAAGELLGRAAGPAAVRGTQALIERAGGMLSPAAREFVSRYARRLYHPYNAKITPGAESAQALTTAGGATLSMGQVVDDPLIDTLEGIARVSWFSKGMMGAQQRGAVEANMKGLQGYVDGIIKGVDPQARAALLIDTLKGSDKAFSAAASRMYGEVDALYGTAGVDIGPALQWAGAHRQELLKTMGKQADVPVGRLEDFIAPGNPARPIAGLAGKPSKVPQRVLRPGTITFQEAQKLRSGFIRLKDIEGDAAAPETRKVTTQLVKLMDEAIDKAGAKLPGGGTAGSASAAWRAANDFYRSGSDSFNSPLLIKWINSENPSTIYKAMTTAPIEDVNRLMTVINSYEANLGLAGRPTAEMVAAREAAREAKDNTQGGIIERMLHQSTQEVGPGIREVSGDKLGTTILKMSDVGDARLKAIFGADHKEFFDRVKGLQFALAGPEKGGIGQLSIQQRSAAAGLTVVGAALGALGGNALGGGPIGAASGAGIGTAATIVLGSRALAALFRDKVATNALIQGLKAPAGTKTGARAMAHFVSQLARLKLLGEPGTKLPIPPPSAGEPYKVEGVETGEQVLHRTVRDKVSANRDRNIERLWEGLAKDAPE